MKNWHRVMKDHVIIYLLRKNGMMMETKISIDDLPKVKKYQGTWVAQYSTTTKGYYVVGSMMLPDYSRKRLHLHRWITDCPDHLVVDHINHDTLNNTRDNIRVVTQKENMKNRKPKLSS